MTSRGLRVIVPAAVLAAVLAVSGSVSFGQIDELSAVDKKSSKPTPRMANGKPDLSGYWKGSKDTKPGGNIG